MHIAVVGCIHGELDRVYELITHAEQERGIKIELLLICGDFQAVRNESDLKCMAVPDKFREMGTFYKYYTEEARVNTPTIFITGNHEASNYMQELPYGGWAAPNLYYLGLASVVKFAGLRIGGLSGIYKSHDFNRGHHENVPYDRSSIRSVYHYRNLEVFRLKQLAAQLDIFLSHDWPVDITDYGNAAQLVRFKPFFKAEIESGTLGSKPLSDLLHHLQPAFWFAAHLHCKFTASIDHGNGKQTRFLALSKVLPGREFFQVIDVPVADDAPRKIELDLEWLAILKLTDHLWTYDRGPVYMPGPGMSERFQFTPTEEEKMAVAEDFGGDLVYPENFECSAPAYGYSGSKELAVFENTQTTLLTTMLDIRNPNADWRAHYLSLTPSSGGAGEGLPFAPSLDNDVTFMMDTSVIAENPDEIDLGGDEDDEDDDCYDTKEKATIQLDDTLEEGEERSFVGPSLPEENSVSLELVTEPERTVASTETEKPSVDLDVSFDAVVSSSTDVTPPQDTVVPSVEEVTLPVDKTDSPPEAPTQSRPVKSALVLPPPETEVESIPLRRSLVMPPAKRDLADSSPLEKGVEAAQIEVVSEEVKDASPQVTTPGGKTFKRRNVAVYHTKDADSD